MTVPAHNVGRFFFFAAFHRQRSAGESSQSTRHFLYLGLDLVGCRHFQDRTVGGSTLGFDVLKPQFQCRISDQLQTGSSMLRVGTQTDFKSLFDGRLLADVQFLPDALGGHRSQVPGLSQTAVGFHFFSTDVPRRPTRFRSF